MAGALSTEELAEKLKDVHVLGIRSKMQVDVFRASLLQCILACSHGQILEVAGAQVITSTGPC